MSHTRVLAPDWVLMSRFMMQALGSVRPLSFDGGGTTPPLLVSAQTPWAGVPFELHATRPFEGDRDGGPPAGEQTALVVIEGSTEVLLRERERETAYRCAPGTFSLHSHDERPVVRRVKGSGKMLAIRIDRAWHDRLVHLGAPVAIRYQSPSAPDATIRALATAMCTEVARGATHGPLYAESLSLAFLSYVLERIPPSEMRVHGALSSEQARRVTRYIDERLHDSLSVNDLAALCGLRARHFSSLFKRALGKTPYRYVIDRRLERGAKLLLQSSADIDDIALRLGFASASHFTAEFRRAYDVTPRRYRRG